MTAQNVPAFKWSENALKVREFLYAYWCEHGRGPNLRTANEATGLARGALIEAYKELGFGEIVFNQTSQYFSMLKCPPFSSYPTCVEVWIDGIFHSFAGCALESVALSRMPPLAGKDVRLESHCACCLAPITLQFRNGEMISSSVPSVRIHLSKAPIEWGIPDVAPMCDSMNYVLDADHADTYERMISRRGVLLDIEQARTMVKGVADNRMWDYHWYPGPMQPATILEHIRGLGVDVTNWT